MHMINKIIVCGLILILLIPSGIGRIEFSDRQQADTYINNAFSGLSVGLTQDFRITQDYELIEIEQGVPKSTRVICWEQTLNINGVRGSFKEMKSESFILDIIFSEDGICFTPEIVGLTNNISILMYIQNATVQQGLANAIKLLVFEHDPQRFIANYDRDIRVNPLVSNSLNRKSYDPKTDSWG